MNTPGTAPVIERGPRDPNTSALTLPVVVALYSMANLYTRTLPDSIAKSLVSPFIEPLASTLVELGVPHVARCSQFIFRQGERAWAALWSVRLVSPVLPLDSVTITTVPFNRGVSHPPIHAAVDVIQRPSNALQPNLTHRP
ncbi:hypothetical protein TWF730_011038 [Orbilia blumenaviensis]|uniref:Uncharacterized protein n=1 Tax=Orbilia blumenaviensis TaxID=1796055 RepID=A0AAV9UKD5_9PEZI